MKKILFCAMLFYLAACTGPKKFVYRDVPNTPIEGFDLANSDPKAIAIADEVMKACGGRGQWDDTRYLYWTYYGDREWIWDKKLQRVRLHVLNNSLDVQLNLIQNTGIVRAAGQMITNATSKQKYLSDARQQFLEDAYELVMPFKLKDANVTLKYVGMKENQIGANCDVLQLAFTSESEPPRGKYYVFVSPSSHLITECWHFTNAKDTEPASKETWVDYRPLGHIFLSGNRGNYRYLAPMGVYKSLPDSVFTTFSPINWAKVK